MAPEETPPPSAKRKNHGEEDAATASTIGYWRWRKDDFFPEPSFASWSAYRAALRDTPSRLRDRFAGRSTDAAELGALRRRSENEMRRCLTWWDLTWFGFGSVIGAGIFVLTGQEAHDNAGPAIVLSYVASGLSAMLSVFCYTEFAVEIPVAGGSFAYLRVELGDVAAFIAAANLILESVLGTAAVGRSWTSYLASLMSKPASALRIQTSSLTKGYDELDPIAVVVIAATAGLAMLTAKGTSRVNWVASAAHVVVIGFVIVAGFIHADPKNLSPFMPHGVPGVFRAAAIVYFAYGGFDNIATMAEETQDPARDIPLGLLGSMSAITAIYVVMALVLSMMQPYAEIDRQAAYSVAFSRVGMAWAQYVVALGALKGMTTVLLVGALGQARYTTHIARSHIIPPVFALVHPKTGTPIHATTLIAVASACIGLFSSLDVLSSLLSVSTLFIFMMLSTAILVRRYYVRGVTTRAHAQRFVALLLLVIGASIGIAAYWGAAPERWAGVRGAGAGRGRDAGDPGAGAHGADAQGVGGAHGAVAALALHRNQPLPHGIARQGRLRPIRRLHRHHAALLRPRRPPRHIRRRARRVRQRRGL
ncbi:hypothetical protein PR202_ga24134 [Eleusine coracana subsp. coracana]|uniref:Cationic amino acid transporter 5 n=1 Tax=Eleusine coracana subsp. coracana TaxID=191504 RepID=A0AAV5D809_ELECO|nr:hypothetical protein PR202_ga24134 [Eleusine coracana subsp. coracana]